MKNLILFPLTFVFFISSCVENFKIVPSSVKNTVPSMDKFVNHLGTDSFGAEALGWEWPVGYSFDPSENEYYVPYKSNGGFGGVPKAYVGLTGMDAGFLKVSRTGSVIWKKIYDDVGVDASGEETMSSVRNPFHQGHIYTAMSVSGNYLETSGGSTDIVLMKIRASDGEVVWRKQLGLTTVAALSVLPGFYSSASSSGTDNITSILLINNKLYFVGHTDSNLGEAASGFDALIIVTDLDGNIEKIKQFGPTTMSTELAALYPTGNVNGSETVTSYLNPDGKIIIAGTTDSSLADTFGGGTDLFSMRINPTTLSVERVFQLGVNQIAGAPGALASRDVTPTEQYRGFNIDPVSGDVYISARTTGSTADTLCGSDDFLILRLDSDLNLTSIKQFGTSFSAELACEGIDRVNDVAFLNGILYLTGNSSSNITGSKPDATLDFIFYKLDNQLNVLQKKMYHQGTLHLGPIQSAGSEWNYGFHVRTDGIFFFSGTESDFKEIRGEEDILLMNTDLNGSII